MSNQLAPSAADEERCGLTILRDYVNEERNAIAAAGLVVLVCWGAALTDVTLAGDDWVFLFDDLQGPVNIALNVRVGRWAAYLVHSLVNEASFSPFFTTLVALASLVGTGVALSAGLGLQRLSAFSLIIMNATSPLYLEFIGFNILHVPEGLGLCLSVIAGLLTYCSRRSVVDHLTPALLVGVSSALYQPTAITFGVAWTAMLVFDTVKRTYSMPSLGGQIRSLATVSSLAAVMYGVSVLISQRLLTVDVFSRPEYDLSTGYVRSFDAPMTSIQTSGQAAIRLFTQTSAAAPALTKYAVTLLVALGFSLWWRQLRRREVNMAELASVSVVAGGGTLLLPFVLWVLREDPVYRYNVIAPLALASAVWVAMAVHIIEGRPNASFMHNSRGRLLLSRAVWSVITLLVVASCFNISRAFAGQELSNSRDLALANRMLATAQRNERFDTLQGDVGLAIAGSFDPFFADRPFRYHQ